MLSATELNSSPPWSAVPTNSTNELPEACVATGDVVMGLVPPPDTSFLYVCAPIARTPPPAPHCAMMVTEARPPAGTSAWADPVHARLAPA